MEKYSTSCIIERINVNTSYGKTHVLVAGPLEGKPVFIFQGGNCINPMTLSWFLPLIDEYRIYAPIGDVFKYTKLEQEMPKLTEKNELINYNSPTLIIAGKKDVFFPESRLNKVAKEIIPNLIAFKTYDIGHFPSEEYLIKINHDIKKFLKDQY